MSKLFWLFFFIICIGLMSSCNKKTDSANEVNGVNEKQSDFENVDINMKDKNGMTLLMYAAKEGNLKKVKELIEKGAYINEKQADGTYRLCNGGTALFFAIESGNLEVVKLLIENNASISIRNQNSDVPLTFATKCGNYNIVAYLLEHNAGVNSLGDNLMTSLLFASEMGRLDLVKLLVDKGADITYDNERALVCALENGNNDVFNYLVQKGANGKSLKLVFLAAEKGNYQIFKTIFNPNRIKSETNSNATLQKNAARGGNIDIINLIINSGINITETDSDGYSALSCAPLVADLKVLKRLLNENFDINAKNSVLSRAIYCGHKKAIELLLTEGADVNYGKQNSTYSPLMNATHANIDTFRFLIEKGADINFKDKNGETILMEAVRAGNYSIVEYLLSLGVDVREKDTFGNTALHYAVQKADLRIFKILHKNGADINAKNNKGNSPILYGLFKASLEFFNYMVLNGADVDIVTPEGYDVFDSASNNDAITAVLVQRYLKNPNKRYDNGEWYDNGESLLMRIVRTGDEELTQYLIKKGADLNAVNFEQNSVLTYAIQGGNINIVKLLIESGADIHSRDYRGITVLMHAVHIKNFEIFKYLVEKGADVNAIDTHEGHSVMSIALGSGNYNIINYLLSLDINFDYNQVYAAIYSGDIKLVEYVVNRTTFFHNNTDELDNPLFAAIREGHYSIVEYLIENGFDVNLMTKNYETPLKFASRNNRLEIVKLLLSKGADSTMRNDKPRSTALSESIAFGCHEITALLISNVADINAISNTRTILHDAVYSNKYTTVKFLLSIGALVDIEETYGFDTALMIAVREGYYDIVELLLDNGADITKKNKNGETAFDIAKKKKFNDIMKLIEMKRSNG